MRLMGENSIALIPAATVTHRSRDTQYPYRQDSNFSYISGFDEPEALIVLVPNRKAGEYLMFCRERDVEQEVWHGRRLGVERAADALGADDAFPISDVDDILPGLLEGRQTVYHTLGKDQAFDAQLLNWLKKARSGRKRGSDPDTFVSLDHHIHEMRLYKSPHEIRQLKLAAEITAAGHCAAMDACRPGLMEYQLEAELIATYVRRGAQHSFLPIVGGGDNACILHYTENSDALNDGELVLIDSGAEFNGYAGDITRTLPINGRFTQAQRDIHDLVLAANLAAIAAVKPGNHWQDPHQAAVKVLTRGLRDLGILKGKLSTLIKEEAYKRFYLHSTGHWLGQDVHDVGEYKVDGEWRLLEPGMVLTIEPGLYFGAPSKPPKRFRNIGVRIEDDVLVTAGGCEVLTASVPKSATDIEAYMAAHNPSLDMGRSKAVARRKRKTRRT